MKAVLLCLAIVLFAAMFVHNEYMLAKHRRRRARDQEGGEHG